MKCYSGDLAFIRGFFEPATMLACTAVLQRARIPSFRNQDAKTAGIKRIFTDNIVVFIRLGRQAIQKYEPAQKS